MPDREKVIKGLEYHLKELSVGKTCFECPYCGNNPCEIHLITDALALLKEQEEEIENLKQTAQSMMEGICLLKEQEAREKNRLPYSPDSNVQWT